MRILLNIICCFYIQVACAQYKPNVDIPVFQYGDALESPFSGGFSAAQFSEIDINFDGRMDIYAFDRGAWTSTVFVRQADNSLRFDPAYTFAFPNMQYWALLRDYNGDGIQDIYTYNGGSSSVYKGSIVDGNYSFSLEKLELIYTDGPATVAVYTSSADIPSIDDIDGDGDLDILSFSVSNATIRFYRNTSIESGYGLDSLLFSLDDYCWGELFEEATCDGATMFASCKGADEAPVLNRITLHAGSTIATFDKDGDGDKDAIIGDNSCDNIVYFRNDGSSEFAQMAYRDSEFPSTSLSFYMQVFPAAFMVDADDDGDRDVLMTTNEHLIGQNTQQLWLYENLNTNDTFDLVFASDTFLVSEVIDAGLYSKPIFFDYNADGLQDILIGVGSTLGKNDMLQHGLWLYENTGTATSPAFTLISTDYANLNDLPLVSQYSPAPGDPDGDGDTDLVIGLNDGTLCYLQNTAGPGNPAAYAAPICVWNSIDVGQLASPCFIDIDLDNKQDLVIGEQNGNLNYYRNTGATGTPEYTLMSEVWGGVDVRETGFITGYSSPFMYRNENDSLYLLVGAQNGKVYGFNEIEEALLGEFFEFTEDYLGWYHGTFASIWGADITGDGKMEWLSGNFRGGFQIFIPDMGVPIVENQTSLPVNMYPNPVDGELHLQWTPTTPVEATIRIVNTTGATVYAQKVPAGESAATIQANWPSGIYLVSVQTADGMGVVKCILK